MVQKSTESADLSLDGASPELIDQVVEISQRIFPGPVHVVREFDPSEPDFPWLSLCVKASGDHQSIFAREEQWHAQVSHLVADQPGLFRLSVSLVT